MEERDASTVSFKPPPPRTSAVPFKAPSARAPPKSKGDALRKGKDKVEDEDAPTVVESIESSDERESKSLADDAPRDLDQGGGSPLSNSSSISSSPSPPPLPVGEYEVPEWAGRPKHAYRLEVVKGGVEVERIDINSKDHFVVGRAEGCDLVLLHPSVSRRHAVIQHRASTDDSNDDDDNNSEAGSGGVFVYDLGSTHGTFVGKRRVGARQYCELRVGDMVRFGASTRLFVLTAPDQETVRQEEERRLVRRKRAAEERRRYPEHHRQQQLARRAAGGSDDDEGEDDACGWGMGDDAVEEEEMEEEMERMDHEGEEVVSSSLFQGTTADAKAFMKRHRQEERDRKLQKMRRKGKKNKEVQQQNVAEDATTKKKKKQEELVPDKAEEAKLREEEELRRAVVEEWDQTFDDDDDFYDRVGRHAKGGRRGAPRRAETMDSLKAKLAVLLGQKEMVALDVEEMARKIAAGDNEEEDELDSFMRGLSTDMSKKELKKKEDLHKSLLEEIARVERLLELAQPALDRVAGGPGGGGAAGGGSKAATKRGQAGLAADVERIKQEYLARMHRDKQKEAQKKERAKRKLQEIKEREKQEDEERKVSSASVLKADEEGAVADGAEPTKRKVEERGKDEDEDEDYDSSEDERAEERKNEDEYVMGDREAAERRRERNRKKREKKREREKKKQKFDDEAVMDEEHQEQGYGYSEWVPPSSAQHYTL